ncbi:MAG: hypothetical protein QOE55_5769 [Acidobacteriaceae bacterium]|nr:hypothetical protein [Acidobacteriaceae bacterium]
MFHKIMVAYDESSEAARALRDSIYLAKALSAELSVVTVLEPIPRLLLLCGKRGTGFQLDRGKAVGTAHSRLKPGNRPRLQASC